MLMNPRVPTVAGIQRTTALLTIAISATLLAAASARVAAGCLIGGGLIIANLYLLQIVAKTIFRAASRGPIGIMVAPLKIVFLMLVVYLLIARLRIDLAGFVLGVLTQFAAIFIETGRVSIRAAVASEGSHG